MSANGNGAPPTGQPAPRAQILITQHADGSVQVQGHIHDKVLAFGLLACAHDAIQEHAAAAAQSKIVPAQMADPFLMKKSH